MYNPGMVSWQEQVRRELAAARQARGAGKEGRARVCARRAAGIAAREYLVLQGESSGSSAYDALQHLSRMPEAAPTARRSAGYLTLRVNEDFELPEGVDLIHEARQLCLALHPALDI